MIIVMVAINQGFLSWVTSFFFTDNHDFSSTPVATMFFFLVLPTLQFLICFIHSDNWILLFA